MSSQLEFYESPHVQKKVYALFRDYFDRAERNRRWNLVNDIPWSECNPGLNPAIADVVQTFCMVELYLPDYVGKQLPMVRANRGRAWMVCNWGYEEAKHSMVLGDWLLKSGARTDEQMTDMENSVFSQEYNLPFGSARGMICYTSFQELATQIHYRNLKRVAAGKCPALDRILHLVAVDEAAHGDFFRQIVKLHLDEDRENTLEAIRQVVATFSMPAVELFSESLRRAQTVRDLQIFNEEIYFYEVLEPTLHKLGLTRKDVRRKVKKEWDTVPTDIPKT
ncbi:MAG: acyl-ACP desaturase [Gemmataceae bacterium]